MRLKLPSFGQRWSALCVRKSSFSHTVCACLWHVLYVDRVFSYKLSSQTVSSAKKHLQRVGQNWLVPLSAGRWSALPNYTHSYGLVCPCLPLVLSMSNGFSVTVSNDLVMLPKNMFWRRNNCCLLLHATRSCEIRKHNAQYVLVLRCTIVNMYIPIHKPSHMICLIDWRQIHQLISDVVYLSLFQAVVLVGQAVGAILAFFRGADLWIRVRVPAIWCADSVSRDSRTRDSRTSKIYMYILDWENTSLSDTHTPKLNDLDSLSSMSVSLILYSTFCAPCCCSWHSVPGFCPKNIFLGGKDPYEL